MTSRAQLVGFNHVALEVGDIEEALQFYGRLFEVKLRGRPWSRLPLAIDLEINSPVEEPQLAGDLIDRRQGLWVIPDEVFGEVSAGIHRPVRGDTLVRTLRLRFTPYYHAT